MLSQIIPILMVFGFAAYMGYLAYDAYKSYREQQKKHKAVQILSNTFPKYLQK